jgi:opacity protein-like surface antigen
MLSLGGRLQPFALIGAGVGLTRVRTTLLRTVARFAGDVKKEGLIENTAGLGWEETKHDIGADQFCNYVDRFGYSNPYGGICDPNLFVRPDSFSETLTFDELDANVMLKGGVGLDIYLTRNIAASIEARVIWLDGYGSVPLDLSVNLLYRF